MTGGCRRACRTQKLVGFVQFGGQQQSVPWPSSTRRLVNDMTTCNKSSPPLSPSIQRNPEPILQGANGVFALRSITRRFFPSTHVAEREAQQCLMVCGQPEPVNSGGGWGWGGYLSDHSYHLPEHHHHCRRRPLLSQPHTSLPWRQVP